MNEPQKFRNDIFGFVRVLEEENGTVLFCGNDVANALGYNKPSEAIQKYCRYTLKRRIPHPLSPETRTMEMLFIPEGDVYRLIFRSKLESAERFERWIFDEVIPSVRRHSAYMTSETTEAVPLHMSTGRQEDENRAQALIRVTYDNDAPSVSGRELHEKLKIGTEYAKWFDRMCEYGFEEGKDYSSILTNRSDGLSGKPRTDHILTLDMAKQICMIQRTEIGRTFREYFLEIERQWNTPEAVMARALKMAQARLDVVMREKLQLETEKSALAAKNQILVPKADYFDALVDRNLLTSFRETAKQYGIGEKKFIAFLIDNKYIYRDKRGKLLPYAKKNAGLFEVKECINEKTGWSGTQTFITPKGRETFRLLCSGI